MRTFVLGDVHGAHRALLQVFERSGFDYENDRLISIGDIVDGWPDSADCVEELLKIKNLIAIRGNHDEWAMDMLVRMQIHEWWFEFGGKATYDSYLRSGKMNDPRHRDFFVNQVDYHVDEKNRLFVHAGYNLQQPIVTHERQQLNLARSYWNYLKKATVDPAYLVEDRNGFTEVFIGHTQTIREFKHDQPVQLLNCWNVDQGAKTLGRLTMMDVETKAFVQSDPVFMLYPDFDF
ncbi:MAG: serine/threonine protein phosphatase [Bacteroidetes bacterium]|nr:MAG: serine/threonine protein phosphatase [Bacteroidota bacterium]